MVHASGQLDRVEELSHEDRRRPISLSLCGTAASDSQGTNRATTTDLSNTLSAAHKSRRPLEDSAAIRQEFHTVTPGDTSSSASTLRTHSCVACDNANRFCSTYPGHAREMIRSAIFATNLNCPIRRKRIDDDNLVAPFHTLKTATNIRFFVETNNATRNRRTILC